MQEGFKASFNANGRVERISGDPTNQSIAAGKEIKSTLDMDQKVLVLAHEFVALDLKQYDLKKKLEEISAQMMNISGRLDSEEKYSKEVKTLLEGQSEDHVENDAKEYERLEEDFQNTQKELNEVDEKRAKIRFAASMIAPTAEDYFMQMVLTLEDAEINNKAKLN